MTPKRCVPANISLLLLLLALASLSACADVFQPEKRPQAPLVESVEPVPEPEPAPALPPEKPAASAMEQEPVAEVLQSARPFPPENLIGVSQEEAEVLFGRPGFVTQEPPAEVWRYLGPDGCSLKLFFYLDVSNSAYRALTYQVEPEDHDPALCIGSIYERRASDG
jgi:hypothetical protein